MKDSNIRLSRPTDIDNLVALDLKTYPYPMNMESWRKLVQSSGMEDNPRVVVIDVDGKSVGFATWLIEGDACHIVRLGIRKSFGNLFNYRRRGLGTRLVEQCALEAKNKKKKKMSIFIPECNCIPDDPDNVVPFLNATGFKPTGEIIEEFGTYYGELKDAYVFEREV